MAELRGRLDSLYHLGRKAYLRGDAEQHVDLADAAVRVELDELPRAQARAALEVAERRAERAADPEGSRLRLAEDLRGGWTDDPTRARPLPERLRRRMATLEGDGDTDAARELAQVAEESARVNRLHVVDAWRHAVLAGTADPREVPDFDLPAEPLGQVDGAAMVESRARVRALSAAADQRAERVARAMGELCVSVLGPDGYKTLEALLQDAGSARAAGERGWA